MKTLLIILSLINIPLNTLGQANNDTRKHLAYNYKKCVFAIKPEKWNFNILPVIAMLTNQSDDTLKYELGHEQIYYIINNPQLQVFWPLQMANGPLYKATIPPHQSLSIKMTVFAKNRIKQAKMKFKIGFKLILVDADPILIDNNGTVTKISEDKIKSGTHFIWSNTVKI